MMNSNNKKLSFIKPVKSFKYSVNIKFDMGDYEKINSFIPTANNVMVFKELFETFRDNPVSRANLLIGAYGTGKSLFATILSTLLAEQKNKTKFNLFIDKISNYNDILAEKMRNKLEKETPYLIILPSTDHNSFKQAMLIGLQRALVREGIADIFPSTYYQSVLEKLRQWETEYPETYIDFKQLVKENTGSDLKTFKDKIKSFDRESYDLFVDFYARLTSGGVFSPFFGCNVNDIYQEVNREVIKKGYKGLFIVFDEFNKLLEDNVETFNGKELQDFTEMATRSGANEIHLLLITHKNLIQYTNELPKKQIDEWKKIEGRFKKIDASQYSNQIYELIESVIVKKDKEWKEFKEKNNKFFAKITDELNKFTMFPNYSKTEIEQYIVGGCYPLHPLASYLLPKLSQRIAQNERTIFTFLSTEEKNTLGEFITQDIHKEFPLLDLSQVYDYFEDLMRQELEFVNVHEAWSDSQRALQKIDINEKYKAKFIKSLAIINAVNNFNEVPPSQEILRFALLDLTEQEFEKLVDELIADKIILYRKSLDQYLFFEGSEIDFNSLLADKIAERAQNFYGKYLLDNYFKPNPVYPKGYNDEYKIRRFFANEFMYLNELEKINDWDDYLAKYNEKSYADGLIVYLLLKTKEEISRAKDITARNLNRRVIFVIPNKPISIDIYLKRLDALLLIKDDKELISRDSLAKKEVEAYIEETKQLISNTINKFTEAKHGNSIYINMGERKTNIYSSRALSNLTSEICFDVFNKTPKINNELIVKNKISAPQKKARKEINSTLLFDKLEARLNITGYGPDYLIYRTLFIKTNLLLEQDEDKIIINPRLIQCYGEDNQGVGQNIKQVDKNLLEIIQILRDKLFLADTTTTIGEVYDLLRRPPYGLRMGIIPLLLVFAGRIDNDIQQVIIKHNGQEREIDAQLFEEINKYSFRFTMEREHWSDVKEEYIVYLEKLFASTLSAGSYNDLNRLNRLFYAIRKWYQTLPKFSRETGNGISEISLQLRNILSSRSSEVKRLMFDAVSKKLLGKEELVSEEDLKKLKKYFKEFRIEHIEAHRNLLTDLQKELTIIFAQNGEIQFKESISNWYNSLAESAKIYTYSRASNSFLNILRKVQITEMNEDELINKLALSLTGFNTEDWNDNTAEEFLQQIVEAKDEIEGVKNQIDPQAGDYFEFVLLDKTGRKYQRSFKEEKLEGLADTLEKKIRGSMKNIGSFVSDQEKQQILINILRDIFDDEGIA